MRYTDHCRALRRQLARYLDLVAAADPTTPVPTCPGWDLARLTGHLGSTHRWVTEMVVTGAEQKLPFGPYLDTVPGDAAALPEWLAEGAEKLLAGFEATMPVRPVWAWGADQQVRFWPRRLLHEAAVHHADAALALGTAPGIPPEVAVDGVDEFLANLPLAAFRPPDFAAVGGDGRSIALEATDAQVAWRITPHRQAFSWRRTPPAQPADVVVRASAADLYLLVWGRVRPPGVTGDADLLTRWTAATAL